MSNNYFLISDKTIKIFNNEIEGFINTSDKNPYEIVEEFKGKLKKGKPYDAIFINVEANVNGSNRSDLKGIELIFWLRLKYNYAGPIITYGFLSSAQILRMKPQYVALHAPGNIYWRLGDELKKNKIDNFLFNKVEVLESYNDFVYPVFDFRRYAHAFANSYGFHLMLNTHREFHDKCNILEYKTDVDFQFFLAEYLFKNSKGSDKEKELAKAKLKELKEINDKTIVHIDDEGEDRWYELFKEFLPLNSYRPILMESYKDYEKDERIKIVKEIFNKGKTPDLILIDLRLLGQKEETIAIDETSGARLIKEIREHNHFVKIILISATDRIKSLELLQDYPYNVDTIWRKPRVDRNKLNLYTIYTELLSKLIDKLKTQSNLIKIKRTCDYKISQSSKKDLPSFLDGATHVFFDTNSLLDTKTYYSLQCLLHKLALNKDIHVGILSDVWKELIIHSNNQKSRLRNYSKDSLNRLLSFVEGKKLMSTHSLENLAISSQLEPHKEKNVEIEDAWNVKMTQEIVRFKALEESEAEIIVNKYSKLIEGGEIKTLVHADDQFRIIFSHYAKSRSKNRKIVFLNNDKKLKKEIAKELFLSQSNLIINNISIKRVMDIPSPDKLKGDVIIKCNKLTLMIKTTENFFDKN